MSGAPPSVTTESILAEFPALTPDTAGDLADRIREPAAAENVINILRSCPPEHAGAGAGLITTQMDTHDAEILHQIEPDERPDFGDSLWIDSDGFSPFRTTVIKLACAALARTEPHLLEAELEDLDPWICQIDNMRLNPDLKDWESCREHRALWKRYVLDRNYDENTARLLGHSKGSLPVWNVYADVHKVDNLTLIPIRGQAELATEAALQDPDLYPRYVNRCIANNARMFVVMDDNTGRTTTLCALRFRKGRWQVSHPTWMTTDEETVRTLTKFAKLYNTRAPRKARKHRAEAQAEEHHPSKNDPHQSPSTGPAQT